MTAFLTDFKGGTWQAPPLAAWNFLHGFATSCDSFEISFVYSPEMLEALKGAVRFRAEHDGRTVFFGIVDEVEISADYQGFVACARGRGMQALLMDSEALPSDYAAADLDYILKRHVIPFGICDIDRGGVSARGVKMSVSSGRSHWSVLSDFLSFSAGVRARFSREGVLVLNGEAGGETRLVSAKTPISSQRLRQDRYGVLSEVAVQSRFSGRTYVCENAPFKGIGGRCERVVSVPKYTGLDVMRYTGEYQIKKSMEGLESCSITICELFAAFPGDILTITDSPIGLVGDFLVRKTRCWADGKSAGTVIEFSAKR